MSSFDCSGPDDANDNCSESSLEIPQWAIDYAASHYDRRSGQDSVIEQPSADSAPVLSRGGIHIVNNLTIVQGGSEAGGRVFHFNSDRDRRRESVPRDNYDYYRGEGNRNYRTGGSCNQGRVYVPRDNYDYYRGEGNRNYRTGESYNPGRDTDYRRDYRYSDNQGSSGAYRYPDGRPYRRPEPGWRQHVDGRYSDPFGRNSGNRYDNGPEYYEQQQRRAYEEQQRRAYEQRYGQSDLDAQRYRESFRNQHGSQNRQSSYRYEDNSYARRTRQMVHSMVGRSIRQYDPSIPERLGCARFVSVALNSAHGLNIHDASVNGLEQSLQRHGFVAVPLSQARPGDVIIGKRGAGKHGHAAIYMGDGQIANNSSSSRVIKIDSVDKFNSRSYVSAVAYRPRHSV